MDTSKVGIRTLAMSWADENTLNSTANAKFSAEWWLLQINFIKDVVAQETGFYQIYHPLSVTANLRTVSVPTTLCWGITRILYRNKPLDAKGAQEWAEDGSWRDNEAGTPTEYSLVGGGTIEFDKPPDRTAASAGTLLGATAGGNFGNQPGNDGIEIVSSSTSDTTQTIDCYGTSYLTGTVVKETLTLNGTTAVASVKLTWGDMLGFQLSAACAGTITIREASGNATITTIAPAATTAGMTACTDTDGGLAQPLVASSGTSTAVVGVVGTDEDGTTVYDNCANLYGTATITQQLPYRMDTVTYLLHGAVASTNNVTLTRGAAVYMLGGACPADLSADGDTITGLPAVWVNLISHGAVAMASLTDIYESQQQARASAHGTAFWQGIERFKGYLAGMQLDREFAWDAESVHAP